MPCPVPRLLLAAASLILLPALPAASGCRLALALAMDVSRSVDARDFAIQTQGLADALEAPEVQEALFAPGEPVALAIYQWSGESYQEDLADWHLILTPDDLRPLVALLRGMSPPLIRQNTALGAGLDHGRILLARAPDCRRHVLDMAGDGRNNAGPTPVAIYGRGGWEGITVNGLAIGAHELGIESYYRSTVIRGPGAFVAFALRQEDFPETIRRKLVRELTESLSWRRGKGVDATPPAG